VSPFAPAHDGATSGGQLRALGDMDTRGGRRRGDRGVGDRNRVGPTASTFGGAPLPPPPPPPRIARNGARDRALGFVYCHSEVATVRCTLARPLMYAAAVHQSRLEPWVLDTQRFTYKEGRCF